MGTYNCVHAHIGQRKVRRIKSNVKAKNRFQNYINYPIPIKCIGTHTQYTFNQKVVRISNLYTYLQLCNSYGRPLKNVTSNSIYCDIGGYFLLLANSI